MKNVPIKFRGESAIGAVYGFYVEREGKAYIVNDAGTYVSVEKESVRQYIMTINGVEVYEGDIAPDSTGEKVRWGTMPCIYHN